MNGTYSSRSPPEDAGPAEEVMPEENGSDFLLVKNCNPWFTTANEDAIVTDGESFDLINSGGITDRSLDEYRAILIPSTQSAGYYDDLIAEKEKIESFVSNGGLLIAHVTDAGYPCTTEWEESFLPQDVTHETTFEENLSLEAPDHPVYEDVDGADLDGWNLSSHGYLTNVPEDATVVVGVADDPQEKPSYIEYDHGNGTVLATTQTIEWPWGAGENFVPDVSAAKEILRNEIAFEDQRQPETVTGQVDVLSFIPGESENSIHGGDPFNSATSQFFPEGFEINLDSGPLLPSPVEVETTPLFDNWGTGEMITSGRYPNEIGVALAQVEDKYEEPIGDSRALKYKIHNRIAVEFEATAEGEINDSSVRVSFTGDMADSVLEQEDINTPKGEIKEFAGLETNAVSPGFRPRHYHVEPITVDGTDAVRVSTIFGGNTRIANLIQQLRVKRGTVDFLLDVLDWNVNVKAGPFDVPIDRILTHISDSVEVIESALAAVPNIYSFVEFIVTADDQQLVRVWDASLFPEHAVFVSGNRQGILGFSDETGIQELVAPNFLGFLAEANAAITPYFAPRLVYKKFVLEGVELDITPHPEEVYRALHHLLPDNLETELPPYQEVTGGLPLGTFGDLELEPVVPDDPLFPLDPEDPEVDHEQIKDITIEPFSVE